MNGTADVLEGSYEREGGTPVITVPAPDPITTQRLSPHPFLAPAAPTRPIRTWGLRPPRPPFGLNGLVLNRRTG
ncbi:hypothetical protein AB0D57_20755 [Streptomyces sp. NPDC048275]|uniref:hypothetical protein n=1 Tax=Streptomyces sp. NPDC048275 TaxID=3155629 RepID=UPI0033C8AAF2